MDLTIAACAHTNTNLSYTLICSGCHSVPTSWNAPSSYRGGRSLWHQVMKRNNPQVLSRIQSTYQEEAQGYVNREYEDKHFELTPVCIKVYTVHVLTAQILTFNAQLHYHETSSMTLTPDMPFADFRTKFCKQINGLGLVQFFTMLQAIFKTISSHLFLLCNSVTVYKFTKLSYVWTPIVIIIQQTK